VMSFVDSEKFDSLMSLVLSLMPDAIFDESSDGEIIISTGLKLDLKDKIL
jgi:hypothetical protein